VLHSNGFGYMAKFCYDYNALTLPTSPPAGTYSITLTTAVQVPPSLTLLLYDDEATGWPSVCTVPCAHARVCMCIQCTVKSQAVLHNTSSVRTLPYCDFCFPSDIRAQCKPLYDLPTAHRSCDIFRARHLFGGLVDQQGKPSFSNS
jgi:hypothetical protein